MNEILYRRELKRVLSYGISKHIAKDIVQGVLEIVKSPDQISKYIDYAIDLQYGLGLSQKQVNKI